MEMKFQRQVAYLALFSGFEVVMGLLFDSLNVILTYRHACHVNFLPIRLRKGISRETSGLSIVPGPTDAVEISVLLIGTLKKEIIPVSICFEKKNILATRR